LNFNIFFQLFSITIIVGSQYALMSMGFVLIYKVTRVFHFAHGITFIIGAYITSYLYTETSIPLLILICIISIFICGLFGIFCELLVYKKLRNRGIKTTGFLLASLGIYIIFQNLISISFGDETQSISVSGFRTSIEFLSSIITSGQLFGVIVALVTLFCLSILINKTKIGKVWRACSDDQELARISGINFNSTILFCFFIGSILAGLTGIIVSMDIDLTPTRGMEVLIISFIIYSLVDSISISAISIASIFLAASQTYGGWFLGTKWQLVIAFIILLVYLLFHKEILSINSLIKKMNLKTIFSKT